MLLLRDMPINHSFRNGTMNTESDRKGNRLTPEDKDAAERLRHVWETKRREKGLTQEKAGEAMDIGQGAVSHYLHGRLKLTPAAVLKWSALLDVDPREIRPDWETLAGLNRIGVNEDQLAEIIAIILRTQEESRVKLSSDKLAELAAYIYNEQVREGDIDRDLIKHLVKYSVKQT